MPRLRFALPTSRVTAIAAIVAISASALSIVPISSASASTVKHSHGASSSRSSRRNTNVTVAPDEVSAGVDAKAQGHRVEALSLRTETSQTFVNPDGTDTVESTMLPARVKDAAGKDGWRDIDLDLKVNADGSISPKSPLYGLTLNGGGAGQAAQPLLTLSDGSSKSLSLGWDRGKLSTPVIDGDTVTYPDVRPNEDLVITATRTGFEQSLVLNAKPSIAADANIQMPVTAHGLKLKNTTGGQFQITDMAGHAFGGAGPPDITDATTGTDTPSPAADATATMTIDTTGSTPKLDVTPSTTDLNDAVYPLTIDPTVSFSPGADTYVSKSAPNTYYSTANVLRTGKSTDGSIYRSYMKWTTIGGIANATVAGAQLRLYQNASGVGCTATSLLHLYPANNQMQIAAMNWNNQPTSNTSATASAAADLAGGTSCPAGTFTMDVTNLMQHFASEGDSEFTMLMQSDETSTVGYKQFGSADAADSSHYPLLTVTYAHQTGFPTGYYIDGQNGVDGNRYIPSRNPTVIASAVNPDGDAVHFTVEFFSDNDSTDSPVSSCTFIAQSGQNGKCTASPALTDGEEYWYHIGATVTNYAQNSWTPLTSVTVTSSAPAYPVFKCGDISDGSWISPRPDDDIDCLITTVVPADSFVNQVAYFGVTFDHEPEQIIPAEIVPLRLKVSELAEGEFTHPSTDGGHTISVRSIGYAPTVFSASTSIAFGLGQTTITSLPNGGRVAGGTAALTATAPADQVNTASTGAHLEWSLDGQNWTTSSVRPTVAVTGNVESAVFDWNTREAVQGTVGSGDDASISVKVAFDGAPGNTIGGVALTTPVSHVVRVAHPFGSQYPTASAGSGTVSLYTGEFTTTSEDVSAPSLGGSLSLSRTYDSHNPTRSGPSSIFGPGWSASLSDGEDGYAEAAVSYQATANTLFINDPILSTDLVFDATGLSLLSGSRTLRADDSVTSGSGVTVTAVGAGSSSPMTLKATELDGTVTTWNAATPGAAWVLSSVVVPGDGSTTTYYADGSGHIDAIVTHPTAVTACDSPLAALAGQSAPISTQNLVDDLAPGCTALSLSYGTATATPAASPAPSGDYDQAGQLQSVASVAFDPTAGANNAGAMAAKTLARYAYDAPGRLAWFDDLTSALTSTGPGQTTTYQYATETIAGAPQQLLTQEHTAGFAPIDYSYGGSVTAPEGDAWPLTSVDRGNADGSAGTSRLATIVYGLPDGTSPLPTDVAELKSWGQDVADRPVTSSVAVFADDFVPPSTPSSTDLQHGTVYYMDPTGFQTNTASFGAGAWQFTDSEYLADGTPSYSLSPQDIADAIAWDNGNHTTPFDYASRETITRYYASDPTGCAAVPANTLVEDVWGPVEDVTNDDGEAVPEREHTHYVYDENPNSTVSPSEPVINPVTNAPFELPTSVTVGATDPSNYSTDPAAGIDGNPPCGIENPNVPPLTGDTTQISKTSLRYSPLDASVSDTAPSSGWVLGQPTVTDKAVGSSGADIVTKSVYAASGDELERIAPGSTGSDAATTITYLYGTSDPAAPADCRAHPEWGDLVCQTGPAAQPTTGQPLPVSKTTYNYWLEPLVNVDTAGAVTRTSTSTYLPYGQDDTQTTATTGLPNSVPVPMTKSVYDPVTFLQTGTETVDSSGSITATDSQSIDQWGRQISYTDSLGDTTTTSYVPAGQPGAGDVAQVTNAMTTTNYSYDGTDANGSIEHRGLLTGMAVSGIGSYSAAYDDDGNLITQKMPGGVNESIGYDTRGNDKPVSLTYSGHVNGSSSAGTWLSYLRGYDAAGRVSQEWSPEGNSNSPDGYSKQYRYDEADRLINVEDATDNPDEEEGNLGVSPSCTVRDYTFDVNGNRTGLISSASDAGCTTNGVVTSKNWSYDIANRQTTGANGSGSYVYDALGRQTTVPASDAPHGSAGNISLAYYDTDAVRSTTQNGSTTTYSLDPDGRRLAAQEASSTVTNHYTSDDDAPAWATQTSAGGTQTSVYSADISGVLGATTTSNGTSQATSLDLGDMGGNVVATVVVPPSGTATTMSATANYDEYGNAETGGVNTGANQYGWLGTKQRAADLTGLVLMGARLYNIASGRFTSPDPVPDGNENAYNYPNDPVNTRDITGQALCAASDCPSTKGPTPGVYVVVDKNGKVIRTGQSNNIERRTQEHARSKEIVKAGGEVKRTKTVSNKDKRTMEEQKLYDEHPEAQAKNGGLNKRQPIGKNGRLRAAYDRWAASGYDEGYGGLPEAADHGGMGGAGGVSGGGRRVTDE